MRISDVVLFGTSHKTAPLELREKVALSEDVCLQGMGHLVKAGVIAEIIIYSTCNRLEFLCVARDHSQAPVLLADFLKAHTTVSDNEIQTYFYTKTGLDAVRHLFCVAASLDSMVVGEPQILGQLKQAYRLSHQARSTGVILNRLLHKTFSAAKKVRTETAIGSHAVSISHAAVELARKQLGDLSNCDVLLIGAGEMGALAARKLAQQRPRSFFIVNRTYTRAQDLAAGLSGQARARDELDAVVEKVDLVISSAVCNNYILWYNNLINRTRPLVVIDIGLPRNADPAINNIPGCTVYDLDSLKQAVEQNLERRGQEASAATVIIDNEVEVFARWVRDLALQPTMLALRDKLYDTVMHELARSDSGFDNAAAEQLAKSIVNRFWHDPARHLKDLSHENTQPHYLDIVRKLFDLDT